MAGLGGKNWTFQEEVTSSDVNGYLADQAVMRFADAATRTAGFGGAGEPTLAEGMVSYLDDQNKMYVYDGSTWREIALVFSLPITAIGSETVNTSQATSSTSYTDLSTVGPAVTLTTGTSALINISATILQSGLDVGGFVAVAVSGATTLAASDDNGISGVGTGVERYGQASFSRTFKLTGLTAGSNTFTLKYKASTGTSISFLRRSLTVSAL